jgi:hypothetical protein
MISQKQDKELIISDSRDLPFLGPLAETPLTLSPSELSSILSTVLRDDIAYSHLLPTEIVKVTSGKSVSL